MTEAVFDSNIVIDLLAGSVPALGELARYTAVSISIITWIEVMAGTKPPQEEAVRRTIAGYTIIPLTTEIAERAARTRRERRIKLPDAIIQASAEALSLTLVTRNERDFPEGTPGVRIPYRL